MKSFLTEPGKFYLRVPLGGVTNVLTTPTETPDVWICRRVEDYKQGQIPKDAAFDSCVCCDTLVVFNPATKLTAPKVCMQCEGIEPLEIV